MTKATMLLGANPLCQPLCILGPDVKKAIQQGHEENSLEFLDVKGVWQSRSKATIPLVLGGIYRICQDCVVEREYKEEKVFTIDNGMILQVFMPKAPESCPLHEVLSHKNFAGVVYQEGKKEYFSTCLDNHYGTPIRVRFYTE